MRKCVSGIFRIVVVLALQAGCTMDLDYSSDQAATEVIPGYDLSGAPTTIYGGTSISVAWIAPDGHAMNDWVGLFPEGGTCHDYVDSVFVGVPDIMGMVSLNVPAGATGNWEFRYYANNSCTLAAYSDLMTAEVAVFSVSGPASGVKGYPVQVDWTAPAGHAANDWVGLFQGTTRADAAFVNSTAASGSLSLMMPVDATGDWELRYYTQNSWNLVDTSDPITATDADVTITGPVAPGMGTVVQADWTAWDGHVAKDWIGLYNTSSGTRIASSYVNSTATSGSINFLLPLDDPGPFEFRYFANNSWTLLKTSASFEATAVTFAVSGPTWAQPGQTVTASWSAPSGHPTKDWIGFFKKDDPNSARIAGYYVTSGTSGTIDFVMPVDATPGEEYEFRYYWNNSWTLVTESLPWVVLSAAPVTVTGFVPDDGATPDASTSVSVSFDQAIDPATLTAQTTAGTCAGLLQVSKDGFSSCIAFSSSAPVMSGGDTIATFYPAPGLLVNRTYKIRVLPGVEDAAHTTYSIAATQATGFSTMSPDLCDGSVVISQVYGGGGNTGAPYQNDFVVLHNRGTTDFDLTGTSLQYASALGTTWYITTLPADIIPAGGYYLIKLGAGGPNGIPLPTEDFADTSKNMSATGAKLAFVWSTSLLSGSCPSTDVIDFFGYGSANCYEGTALGSLSNTTAGIRKQDGCADVDANVDDFAIDAPAPRNSSDGAVECGCVVQNESDSADEADICDVTSPLTLVLAPGENSGAVLGHVYENGGDVSTIRAQLGVGSLAANPEYQAGWSWTNASLDSSSGDDYDYSASFDAPLSTGDYAYVYRVSLDDGVTWTLCDDGAGSEPSYDFEFDTMPMLTVE